MGHDYIDYTVHTVKDTHRSSGSFHVSLIPEVVDRDRLLGAQLMMDTFTPNADSREGLDNGNGGTVYEGVLGDPTQGDPATLTVHEMARQQNRRAITRQGLARAVKHLPEGTLWVFPRSDA